MANSRPITLFGVTLELAVFVMPSRFWRGICLRPSRMERRANSRSLASLGMTLRRAGAVIPSLLLARDLIARRQDEHMGMEIPRFAAQDMWSFVELRELARRSLVWAPAARHAPRWDGARFLARCGGFWEERLCALGMTVGLWGWRTAPGATRNDTNNWNDTHALTHPHTHIPPRANPRFPAAGVISAP